MAMADYMVTLSGDKTSKDDFKTIKNQIIGDDDMKDLYLNSGIFKTLMHFMTEMWASEQETSLKVAKSISHDSFLSPIKYGSNKNSEPNTDEKIASEFISNFEMSERRYSDHISPEKPSSKELICVEILSILLWYSNHKQSDEYFSEYSDTLVPTLTKILHNFPSSTKVRDLIFRLVRNLVQPRHITTGQPIPIDIIWYFEEM